MNNVRRLSMRTIALCRMGIMVALYVVLTLVSVRIGNLRFTFASLPTVVETVIFGPLEGAVVALTGELLNQMISYGFTATTFLWIIPPAIRVLCIGATLRLFEKKGKQIVNRTVLLYIICMVAAIITTLCNTLVIFADSKINGYYSAAYVFGDLVFRLITGVITAIIVATVTLPVVSALKKK